MQLLGVTFATTALVSVAIYELTIKGGVSVSMESGHVRTFKGEEYETTLTMASKGADWMGSMPTEFAIDTGLLVEYQLLDKGRVRLRFLGKYAGRSTGIRVRLSLTDPLRLFSSKDQVVYTDFVLDTLPLSLLAPAAPKRLTVYGFGEESTGLPGPGQELYGLDQYHSGDAKDIVWKRVAKSPDQNLIARTKERNVRETMTVGVVRFAERGDGRLAWTDEVCEALGFIGKQAFEMGATFDILYSSAPDNKGKAALTRAVASNAFDLAEAVMASSSAPPSRAIEEVVANSDFLITGLKELEDEKLAAMISQRPMFLIYEKASPPSTFDDRSVIYSGEENVAALVRKLLER